MAEGQHMDTQLMTAPSLRKQANTRGMIFVALNLPVGDSRFSCIPINFLARPAGPIHTQRRVNRAVLRLKLPPDPRHIGLFDLPFLQTGGQGDVVQPVSWQTPYTGRIPIKAVHQKRIRERSLRTTDRAIGQMRALPGCKAARPAYQAPKVGRVMQNHKGVLRGIIGITHRFLPYQRRLNKAYPMSFGGLIIFARDVQSKCLLLAQSLCGFAARSVADF